LSAVAALLKGCVSVPATSDIDSRITWTGWGCGWRRVPQTPPAPVGHLRAAAGWAIWWSGTQLRGVL